MGFDPQFPFVLEAINVNDTGKLGDDCHVEASSSSFAAIQPLI